MRLKLVRNNFTDNATEGMLYIDGVFECYTLEDTDRFLENGINKKVYGKTAIPRGVYEVELTKSNRFGTVLPLIKDVPNFTGIRIHPGNTSEDTEGCILVGSVNTKSGDDFIGSSRIAMNQLKEKLYNTKDKIIIEII